MLRRPDIRHEAYEWCLVELLLCGLSDRRIEGWDGSVRHIAARWQLKSRLEEVDKPPEALAFHETEWLHVYSHHFGESPGITLPSVFIATPLALSSS